MQEIRRDTERKEWTDRRGNSHVREASYTIRFGVNGVEIAWYDSKADTFYLNTKYILSKKLDDFKKPYAERIKGSRYETEYAELLGRYKTVSEYLNGPAL